MKSLLRTLASLVLAALLPACISLDSTQWRRVHEQTCALDEHWVVRDTLYFGLSMVAEDGSVSIIGEDDWERFENEVLSSAFPSGYTVLKAHGAWRNASGVHRTEPARVVVVLHSDDPASEAAITETIRRYRERFRQESVLREHVGVCLSL